MKIHALTTGAVRVKHSFLFPSDGRRRQLDLFTPGPFVPRVSRAPGLINGYWTTQGNSALSLFVFDTERLPRG